MRVSADDDEVALRCQTPPKKSAHCNVLDNINCNHGALIAMQMLFRGPCVYALLWYNTRLVQGFRWSSRPKALSRRRQTLCQSRWQVLQAPLHPDAILLG